MTEKQPSCQPELTLPASLERLEINPKRLDGISSNVDTVSHEAQQVELKEDIINPESVLESLSLSGAECPSGTCHCNKRRHPEDNILHKATFKRPVIQRSRLGAITRKVLREPVLKLGDNSPRNVGMPNVAGLKTNFFVERPMNRRPIDLGKTGGKVLGNSGSGELQTDFKSLIDQNCSTLVSSDSYNSPAYMELRTGNENNVAYAVRRRGSKVCVKCPNSEEMSAATGTIKVPANAQTPSCSVQARMSSTQPLQCDDTNIDELASYFDLFVHIPKKMSHMAEMMYI